MTLVRLRKACALCEHKSIATPALTLPDTPLANEFAAAPRRQKKYPLKLYLCPNPSCGHLQLQAVVDPGTLFGGYVYTTGHSEANISHFTALARKLVQEFSLDSDSLVVDIGSNDGTLLREFKNQGTRVRGVEPAHDIAVRASLAGIPTMRAFFSPEVAEQIREMDGQAAIITASNVFAHTDGLKSFALAAKSLLAPDGVFVFEVSYLLDVVEGVLFDTIYHEHLSYHAVRPLVGFFGRLGMTLFDVERIPAQGGSIRCYVSRDSHPVSARVEELAALETAAGLFSAHTYQDFTQDIDRRRVALTERVAQVHAEGMRLCGFSAPAKLTTMFYTFRLTSEDFGFIVDNSKYKQGLFTPGTNIQVVGPDVLQRASGRYAAVVFAWNFFDHIVKDNEDLDVTWINPHGPKE